MAYDVIGVGHQLDETKKNHAAERGFLCSAADAAASVTFVRSGSSAGYADKPPDYLHRHARVPWPARP